MENARAKRAKILFFIVKYANLWGFCCRRRRGCLSSLLSSSSSTLPSPSHRSCPCKFFTASLEASVELMLKFEARQMQKHLFLAVLLAVQPGDEYQ